MKRTILMTVILLTAFALNSHAQCDKKVIWTSLQTEYLDPSGNSERTQDIKTTLETTSREILVKLEGKENEMITGVVRNYTCDWKEMYKNGKSVFRVELHKSNGDTKNGIITIEGVDGKLHILVELEETGGGSMRLLVDSFKTE